MSDGGHPGQRSAFLGSRRARLILLLVVATAAITVLAFYAAGPAMSYYVTPEEFAQQMDRDEQRWRVGGRVVPDSIVEDSGRPVQFEIQGDTGERALIRHGGVVPNLFGPMAFVVVEGSWHADGYLNADNVIIRHEDEFFSDTPPDDSISKYFVPTPTSTPTD